MITHRDHRSRHPHGARRHPPRRPCLREAADDPYRKAADRMEPLQAAQASGGREKRGVEQHPGHDTSGLDRALALEIARVTEAAAIAAARLAGPRQRDRRRRGRRRRHVPRACPAPHRGRRGDRRGRDGREPDALYWREGRRRRRAAQGRYRRRSAGRHHPLRQGHAQRARRCWRIAERGSLLNAPDIYMDKIAIGPGFPEGMVDLDAPPADNSRRWPRPRACRSTRSPPASSTGRATPS